MKARKTLGSISIAILGGLIALIAYSIILDNKEHKVIVKKEYEPVGFASLPDNAETGPCNFTYAAEKTVHAVVHVKTQSIREKTYRNPIYEFFYGESYPSEPQPILGFGSGVIISHDGYIVTNNHVIKGADDVFVTLNDNREFEAKVVGTDPSTDLALLKINDKDLPFITYGSSDDLKLGDWVLAVGNPYNLTSTVTAGIISAKGRNLGILEDQYRIESFIQTDAALNKGNSGGALVNLKGELVGINTAIISPSGGYSGNSFAIPVSIVKKVVTDIIEYGAVQRAILGVTIQTVDAELAKEKGLDQVTGVYVNGLRKDGAAEKAGVEAGDVIIKINEAEVGNSAELQEQISRFRPGDKVSVTIIRKGKTKQFDLVLRNLQGTTGVVKSGETISVLGAKFAELTPGEKEKLGIKNGIKIIELSSGKFLQAGIEKNFIITRINNKPIYNIQDIKRIIESTKGGIYVEGIYPNGVVAYYAFGL